VTMMHSQYWATCGLLTPIHIMYDSMHGGCERDGGVM
jgi:hypothetical protein